MGICGVDYTEVSLIRTKAVELSYLSTDPDEGVIP